jgi:hypothetical protein
MVECMGRTTCVSFSGYNGDVLVGVDVSTPQRWNEPSASFRGYAAGGGSQGATIDYPYKKVVGVAESSSYGIWLAGSNSAGGIARRDIGDTVWEWTTRVYYGEVQDGGSTNPRRTKSRLILIDGTTCFVACKRNPGSPAWGIAKSSDSGATFSAWAFATARNFTAMLKSPQYTCIYATADNREGSGNDGVFILTGLASGTATVTRIDNVGTGAPTLADVRDVWVGRVGTTDYVYVVVGNLSGSDADAGVWLCKVAADPTGGGFSAAASCTWTHILTPGGADRINAIVGYQSGTIGPHLLMAGYFKSSTNSSGTYTLSAGAGGTVKNYRVMMQQCFDGTAVTPSWNVVSGSTNVDMRTYATDRDHVMAYVGETSNENSRFGGTSYSINDMAISADGQRIVAAGKSSPWVCDNPWAGTPVWRPFSKGLGALEGGYANVFVPGTNRVAIADDDRGMYTFKQFGYLRPEWVIAENIDGIISTANAMNTIRLATNGDPLTSRDADGRPYRTTNAWDYNTAVTSAIYTSARTAPSIYVDQWIDGTATSRYIDVTRTAIYRDGTSVATITPTSAATRAEFRYSGNTCWLHIPDQGVYRSTNNGVTWALWWTYAIADDKYQKFCGHMAQDPFDGTTLYFAFDAGGVWKVPGADTASTGSGLGGSVPSGASQIIGGALPVGTEPISAIGTDPIWGDLWACGFSPTGAATPKLYVLRRQSPTTWFQVDDPTSEYAESAIIPQFINVYDGMAWIATASNCTLRRMG